jgi:hypothetical protein
MSHYQSGSVPGIDAGLMIIEINHSIPTFPTRGEQNRRYNENVIEIIQSESVEYPMKASSEMPPRLFRLLTQRRQYAT